ncbi:MAG: hypothetical protein QUS14_15155 [Pyrinomonadaceae bacterium]|nr:hypothetical protein [Pyrinomonadaceae bacterium]
MIRNLFTPIAALIAIFAFAAADAAAQGSERFSDPFVEYSFDIPDARWKQTVKPTEANPTVEYVFVDRNDGHFSLRKTTSPETTAMADIIREEEQKLQFMRGYVAGKQERFAGKLNGAVFNFEFVERGRQKSGRYYFLRSGSTVYILRFTGFADKLRSIQHYTDSMARTFDIKNS